MELSSINNIIDTLSDYYGINKGQIQYYSSKEREQLNDIDKHEKRNFKYIPVIQSRNLALPGSINNKLQTFIAINNSHQFNSLLGKLFSILFIIKPNLFSRHYIKIPKEAVKNLGTIIFFCKRKLRIIDINSCSIICIFKKGLDDSYFEYEKEIRSISEKYVNSPKILKEGVSNNCKYYIEEYLTGNTISKVSLNHKSINKNIDKQISSLLQMHLDNKGHRNLTSHEYASELITKINTNKEIIKSPLRPVVEKVFDLIKQQCITSNMVVKVTTSHGDLSPDNLIINKQGDVYILDWENTRENNVYHDVINYYTWASQKLSKTNINEYIDCKTNLINSKINIENFNKQDLYLLKLLWILEKTEFLMRLKTIYKENDESYINRQIVYKKIFNKIINSGLN